MFWKDDFSPVAKSLLATIKTAIKKKKKHLLLFYLFFLLVFIKYFTLIWWMQPANSHQHRLSKMVLNIWLKTLLFMYCDCFYVSAVPVVHYASDSCYFLFSKTVWKSLEGKLKSRAKPTLATFLSARVLTAFCWNALLTFHSSKHFCTQYNRKGWARAWKVQHGKHLCIFHIYHTIKINLFRSLPFLRRAEKHDHQFLSRAASSQLKIN